MARRAAPPHGDHAVLAALAGDAYQLLAQLHVRQIQADQFGEAQAAGVEQLHDRQVANRQQRVCAIGGGQRLRSQ